MPRSYFPLLVKLGAIASLASLLARSNSFKSCSCGRAGPWINASSSRYGFRRFGLSVAVRVVSKNYPRGLAWR